MRLHFLASFIALSTLAACVPATPQSSDVTEKVIESGRADKLFETAEVIAENEEPIIKKYTGTGATAERFLSTGIIEVGSRDAPLTLLSFTEHHSRYCRQFLMEQFPRLEEDFIDDGLLRYQIVILPLKKYSNSREAAAALLCSASQGKGMAMHWLLFERTSKEHSSLLEYAEELELDTEAFDTCLSSEETEELLAQQEALARSLSVSLVPTFFLNGEKFVGLPYEADLRGRIEQALK